MLSAMSTGHDGSLSTVHTGCAEQALRRVETLALMAGVGLPHQCHPRAGGSGDRPFPLLVARIPHPRVARGGSWP
jgi:Flp pilus assembly CpaF family ATPase